MKTLRDVIKRGFQAAKSGCSLLDTADDLPLWPRISSQPGNLTTKEALVARNTAFVVPWIKDYHRFAKFSHPRPQVEIDDVKMLTQHVLPALPEFINGENKAPYTRLINAIALSSPLKNKAGHFVVPLTTHRLAARQDGKLCLATDLFDHHELVFSAAFRVEADSKFLASEVRDHSALWNGLGLRRRESGRFRGPDYLACLRALEGRLTGAEDQQLRTDVDNVLYPLCTNDGALRDLDDTTWSTIAKLQVFLVSPVSAGESEHRRGRMQVLASERHTKCLKDVIRREFAAVCWSQTAFAIHEPSSFSIEKNGLTGQPTSAMVWQHLAFLSESVQSITRAEVRGFVEDLQKTYHHLSLDPQQSRSQFTQQNAALWLNAETSSPDSVSLDALKSSWTSLEYLLLDSPCDAPPLMTVQPFLGRYSTLLKELGCKSLHYPQVNAPPPGRSETTSTLIRELWKDDVLTDVKFEAEGNSISAHRIVLASRSSYCKAQFGSAWTSASASNATGNVIKLEDMTYATLKILIGFCYHEDHDWAQDMRVGEDDSLSSIADKLDGLLDVLVAANRWLMPDLHADAQQKVIAGIRFFVRPDNVEEVKQVADDAMATKIWNYCEEFGILNAEAVMLANAESG